MHYVRLLSPPHASPSWYDHSENDFLRPEGSTLSLVLAITTDLGDALLSPAQPIPLVAELVFDLDYAGHDPDDGNRNGPVPTGVRRSVMVLPMTPSQADGRAGHKSDKSKNSKNSNAKSKAKDNRGGGSSRPDAKSPVAWHAGMRVLKVDVTLDEENAFLFLCHHAPEYRRRLRIAPADPALAIDHAHQFVVGPRPPGDDNDDGTRIVPLWVDTPPQGPPVPGGTGFRTRLTFPPLALRRLATGPGMRHYVEVEEDLGESIARHVWDAGLAAVAFVADACRCATGTEAASPDLSSNGNAVADALRAILLPPPPPSAEDGRGEPLAASSLLPSLRVLELGSGVGILGIGLAEVVPRLIGRNTTVLLTDLPDAEERLLANIARVAEAKKQAAMTATMTTTTKPEAAGDSTGASTSTLAYENLDWEDGRRGRFGREHSKYPHRPWDLVVLSDCTYNVDWLPALVETLAALHAAARRVDPAFVSHVLLFRKPRHADEEALFGLLAQHGWAQAARSTVPLPGGGKGPGGAMEVYLYRCP